MSVMYQQFCTDLAQMSTALRWKQAQMFLETGAEYPDSDPLGRLWHNIGMLVAESVADDLTAQDAIRVELAGHDDLPVAEFLGLDDDTDGGSIP